MKKKLTTLLIVLIFLSGVGLILYPTLANAWNERIYRHALVNYENEVVNSTEDTVEQLRQKALEYNARHAKKGNFFGKPTEEQKADYNEQLLLGSDDEMNMLGYLEIPGYNIALPIYRGTSDEVLASGIGHLEGTSLPIGGSSSHCVISGHTGFPSAKLLTDLEKVKVGDLFYVKVLEDKCVYEVDQILVVLPNEFSDLQIVDGMDLCTIVTCTPYGINSHRLLVRGHRVMEEFGTPIVIEQVEDSSDILLIILEIEIGIIIIIFLLSVFLFIGKKRSKRNTKRKNGGDRK